MPDAARINRSEALSTVMRLLSVEGTSGEETRVAGEIRRLLRAAGVPAGAFRLDGAERRMKRPGMRCGNLIVRIDGDRRPPRAFSAHMDTVTLARGARPVRRGGAIVSRGETALGADDRAGVAALVSAVRAVLRGGLDHPPLVLIFTVAEEIGLFGARHVDRRAIRGVECAYNFDGAGPASFVTGAPSANHFRIEVTGLASHAGVAPEEGVSAVAAASAAIADLKRNGWFGRIRKGRFAGTSNIGAFRADGPTNIVAPVALLEGEARSHSDAFLKRITGSYRKAFERACRATRSAGGARARVEFTSEPSFKAFRLSASAPVVKVALAAAEAAGLSPELTVGGGGLDANYFNHYGMPTLTMGAGGHDAHTTRESLDIEEHLAGCRLAAALMTV